MSPNGTERLGDVHPLPDCAPDSLKYLFSVTESVIREQIRMLGSGTPSQAPDLHKLLGKNGFSDPDDRSKMTEEYKKLKTKLDGVVSDTHNDDKGVQVETTGIGSAVADAYGAIETAVEELNKTVDASHDAVYTVHTTDKDGKKISYEKLPPHIVDGLFKAAWKAVDATYEQAHGVTDKAAAAALKIKGATPPAPATVAGAAPSAPVPSHVRQASYHPSDGPAPSIPEGQKPTADAIYQYLLEKGFTPAQAAGIIGNMQIESGFKTDAYNAGEGAIGLCQWEGGRRTALEAFAGDKLGDWHTQVDFMVHEMQTSESLAYSQVKGAQTPEDAANAFARYYERCARGPDPNNPYAQRVSAAEQFSPSADSVVV